MLADVPPAEVLMLYEENSASYPQARVLVAAAAPVGFAPGEPPDDEQAIRARATVAIEANKPGLTRMCLPPGPWRVMNGAPLAAAPFSRTPRGVVTISQDLRRWVAVADRTRTPWPVGGPWPGRGSIEPSSRPSRVRSTGPSMRLEDPSI